MLPEAPALTVPADEAAPGLVEPTMTSLRKALSDWDVERGAKLC